MAFGPSPMRVSDRESLPREWRIYRHDARALLTFSYGVVVVCVAWVAGALAWRLREHARKLQH